MPTYRTGVNQIQNPTTTHHDKLISARLREVHARRFMVGLLRLHPRSELRCVSRRLVLKCGRTDVAERRVPTPLVIEHVDVIKQLHLRVAVNDC